MRVVLVDDHALIRNSLRELLESRGVQVLADLDPSPDLARRIAELSPDVVLLDLSMPGANGNSLLRELKQQLAAKVIVLTMHVDEPWVSRALEAGADGYLSKSCSPQELLEALTVVLDGGRPMSPEVARTLAQTGARPSVPRLTPRERQVLKLVARGCTARDLAQQMTVTVNTAKTHLHSLYRKLGVSDRTQLLLLSQRHGWLED